MPQASIAHGGGVLRVPVHMLPGSASLKESLPQLFGLNLTQARSKYFNGEDENLFFVLGVARTAIF
jgi:hypothetical protein